LPESFNNLLGKVGRKFLDQIVFRNLGLDSPSVIVRPGHGFDNAVVSLGHHRVLVLTADPLSIIPSIGMEESAWLTIHLLASDFTTSALRPQFAVLDFNLPPKLRLGDFETYIKAVGRECKKLGIAIVGGHTGKYPGCDFTIAGGGVLFGMGDQEDYLTPAMMRPGDTVIMTKGAAIATTGFLARLFPKEVTRRLGAESLRKASSYLLSCSTVEDAIVASSVGIRNEGITSMHDATEGGVLGALYEISCASKRAIVVEREHIFVSKETRSICSLFGLNDPLVSLSTGTLIITCRPDKVEEVQGNLRRKGRVDSFVIGEVRDGRGEGDGGLWISAGRRNKDEKVVEPKPFIPPAGDPYWSAYSKAVERGWN
jgi:hydrogenase expression/formation protein HypE